MALPANINYGTVSGVFLRAKADGTDVDRNPDGEPIRGLKVTFTPSINPALVKNVTAVPPVTILIDPVVCTTDDDGVLCGPDGSPDVLLVASGDTDLDPSGWTWTVEIKQTSTFPRVSFAFVVGVDSVTDLSTVLPVPAGLGADLILWQQAVADTLANKVAAQTAATDANTAKLAAEAVPTTTDGLLTTIDANPASTYRVQADARQNATYVPQSGAVSKAGRLRLTDTFPEVKSDAGADVQYSPGGAALAAWQVQMNGDGRLFHMRLGPTINSGALIALGMDYGNANYPVGILFANKAQTRGCVIDNQATVTDAAAYGLYVQNRSAAAPGAKFESTVAGAAIAVRVSAENAVANQKLMDWRSNTGANTTEEAGSVRADNGWLLWNKLIKPGGYTTALRPTGLGASTRGSTVYDTDLQKPIVFTDTGWRAMALAPATLAANADTTGATLEALETEVNELKALLRSMGAMLP